MHKARSENAGNKILFIQPNIQKSKFLILENASFALKEIFGSSKLSVEHFLPKNA
jgi:hypothetical protein